MLCGTETSSSLTGILWNESISFAAASHANLSVSLANAKDEPMSDGSGQSLLGALAYYDPATSSLRMCQVSLFEDSPTCSETWPRAGMTRNGIINRQEP